MGIKTVRKFEEAEQVRLGPGQEGARGQVFRAGSDEIHLAAGVKEA